MTLLEIDEEFYNLSPLFDEWRLNEQMGFMAADSGTNMMFAGSEISTDYDYDILGRLDEISHEIDNKAFYSQANVYNDAGMIISTGGVRGTTKENYERDYGYDDTYRLLFQSDTGTPLWGSPQTYWAYAYQYDDAGNRTLSDYFDGASTQTTTYTYNDFNQLTHAYAGGGTSNYYYDANGNLNGSSTPWQTGYNHDRENRLLSTGGDFPGAYYVYDASGRLLMRSDDSGNKRKYYYDGINTLLTREETPSSGCFRTANVYTLKDSPIGQIVAETSYSYATASCAQSPTTDRLWYHYDHIGNVVAFSDANMQLVDSVNMEAFGTVHQGGQAGIRLTTKEYDPASELYYFGARWYDEGLGRWIENEPSGLDGPNMYNYVWGNPVNHFDPTGLYSVEGAVGVGACCVIADGPLPFGDALGLGVVIIGSGYALCTADDRAPAVPQLKKRGKWTCIAKCNLQYKRPQKPGEPSRVSGQGFGSNKDMACAAAKKAADTNVPVGDVYKRHCKCYCSKR